MCSTYNNFKKEGCAYENSNPGDSCIFIHQCSACLKRGFPNRKHKAINCRDEARLNSNNSNQGAPTSGSATAATPVTSVQQSLSSDSSLSPISYPELTLISVSASDISDHNAADQVSQKEDDSSASSILSLSATHKQRAIGKKFLSLDIPSDVDISDCPRDLKKGTFLKPLYYVLNNGQVFVDRLLPDPTEPLTSDAKMSNEYFINLHFSV